MKDNNSTEIRKSGLYVEVKNGNMESALKLLKKKIGF